MTTMADKLVALPTARLVAAAWVGALIVGAVWSGIAVVIGAEMIHVRAAAAGALLVAMVATGSIVALRTWIARPLARWPMLWVTGSFARMGGTLAGTLLLYSAAPVRTSSLWLAVMAAYLAALIGETRVYVHCMQRLGAPSASAGIGPEAAGPSASGTARAAALDESVE